MAGSNRYMFKHNPRTATVAALLLLTISGPAGAHQDETTTSKPNYSSADTHAPIGVMGDHRHNKNEVMLSYRYMHMDMGGNKSGTRDLAPQQVQAGYGFNIVPTEMTMDMHMFGLMYAPTDRITTMVMVPYVEKWMDHVVLAPGGAVMRRFSTGAKGLGDTRLSALVGLYGDNTHKLHLNLGVSAPTGSIGRHDTTPMSPSAKLPYPMQIGSGTWDVLPGVTYYGVKNKFNWGAQYLATLRTGENSNDYTLGDRHMLTGWVGFAWKRWLSTSFRLENQHWGNIAGSDPGLNPMMVQTADPRNQGGARLDAAFGVNLVIPGGVLRNHRLAFEFLLPLRQNLDGPQLETDWRTIVGWQYAF